MDGRKARPLLAMQLGDTARNRWHHPYIVCHRADLQSALLDACRNAPGIEINLGAEMTDQRMTGNSITATIKRENSVETVEAAYLVACDGVWSMHSVRRPVIAKPVSAAILHGATTLAADALPASFLGAMPEHKAVFRLAR